MLKKLKSYRSKRSNKKNATQTVQKKKKPFTLLSFPLFVFLLPFVGWCFIFARREDLETSVWSPDFSRLVLNCFCRGSVFFLLAAYIKIGIDNIGVPGYLMMIACVAVIGWFEVKKVLPVLVFFTIVFSLMFALAGKFLIFHLCCATLNWLWLSWFSKRGNYEFTVVL